MSSSVHGYSVIVHNSKFNTLKKITNGGPIIERWKASKKKTRWHFIPFSNLTATQIIERLIETAQCEQLKDHEEFELMIISHGGYCDETNKNVIFGTDGEPLFVEKIIEIFNDSNCQYLNGKKKSFSFQFCCPPPPYLLKSGLIKYTSLKEVNQSYLKNDTHKLIKDTVIVWSTIRGAKSFRCPIEGTVFVRALCEILQKFCAGRKCFDLLQSLEYLQEKIDEILRFEAQPLEKVDQVTEIKSFGFLRRFQFRSENTENSIDLLTYPFFGSFRGYCLVINNFDFDELPRIGSNSDVKKLKKLFGLLNFKVVAKHDLDATEIINSIKAYSTERTQQVFVLFIMSHGFTSDETGEHVIRAKNDTVVEIKEILDLFSEDNCPQLKGKPKIIIFNACRVDPKEENIGITNYTHSVESDGNVNKGCLKVKHIVKKYFQIENIGIDIGEGSEMIRDTFLLWSTLDGYHCLRKNLKLFWLLIATTGNIPARNRCTFSDYFRISDQFLNVSSIKQYMELNSIGLSKVLMIPPNPDDAKYLYKWDLVEPVGICLIVNIADVSELPENHIQYTEKDIKHLKSVFAYLKFDVIIMSDINREQLLKELEYIRQDPQLKSHNAFVLYFISSSRKEKGIDYIQLHEGEVSVEELKDYFSDYNCSQLRGKPKIFCFECSRGDGILVDDECTNISDTIKLYFDENILTNPAVNNAVISMNTPIATYLTENCYNIDLTSLYSWNKSRPGHRKNRSLFGKIDSDIRDLSLRLDLDLEKCKFKSLNLRDYMDQILFAVLIANNWQLFDESDEKPNVIMKSDSKSHVFHLLKERITPLVCFCSLNQQAKRNVMSGLVQLFDSN